MVQHKAVFLEEKSENLATSVLLLGLLVIDDTIGSGQDNVTELTGWKKVGSPFVNLNFISPNLSYKLIKSVLSLSGVRGDPRSLTVTGHGVYGSHDLLERRKILAENRQNN